MNQPVPVNMNTGPQSFNPMGYGGQQKFPSLEDLKACRIGKKKWSINEDIRLNELVQYYGANEWVLIANMMHNRNSRQCRERWRTKFNPDILKGEWTPEEDQAILAMYADIGSKWVTISKSLPGRTDSDIRNRFFSLNHSKTKLSEDAVNASSSVENSSKPAEEYDENGNKIENDKEKTDLKSTIASLLEQIDKNNKNKVSVSAPSNNKKARRNAPDISMYMNGLAQQQAQHQSMMPYQYPPTSNQQPGYSYPNMYPPAVSTTAPTMPATADGMVPASAYMQLMQQTQMQQQMIEQMQQSSGGTNRNSEGASAFSGRK